MNVFNIYTLGVLLLAILIGTYLNWPSPQLSHRLIDWKNAGRYYEFKNFHQIFYRDDVGLGSEDKILLLIHGYPTSSYDWKKVYDGLKSKFGRIIAPDMLGYGFSSKPVNHYVIKMTPVAHLVEVEHNYTIIEQADVVLEILQQLNVDKVHILSHDYGDTVAQELLHRYNKDEFHKNASKIHIQSLCMLNGGIFSDIYSPRLIQKLMLNPYLKNIIPKLMNYWFFSNSLSNVFGPNKPNKEDLEDWYALTRYNEGQNALSRLTAYIPERKINENKWQAAIKETKARVHFIYGPDDPVNPVPFVQRFRSTFPNATIDVLNAVGHYVQHEAPAEFLASYFMFMSKV